MQGAITPADTADLLVTLDQNYLPQLRVMLLSLRVNNPSLNGRVHLLHRAIPDGELAALADDLARIGFSLEPVRVDPGLFEGAPVTKQYPQEMYYRLLAARFLPESLDRALYLDPDLLVINPIDALWRADMDGMLFAAAPHTGITELANSVNRIRLGTQCKYFNSGVLLIDLARAREEIRPEALFAYVEEHRAGLLLPDQDVLNAPLRRPHPAVGRFSLELRRAQLHELLHALLRSGGQRLGDAQHRHPPLLRQGEAVEAVLPLPLRHALPPLHAAGRQDFWRGAHALDAAGEGAVTRAGGHLPRTREWTAARRSFRAERVALNECGR